MRTKNADQTDRHQSPDIGREAAQSPTLDRLLTARELAAILRVHEVSVRRWALDGTIPSLHVGRSVRFKLADVMAAIESKGVNDDR